MKLFTKKKITAVSSCELFSQKVPSEIYGRVLNTPVDKDTYLQILKCSQSLNRAKFIMSIITIITKTCNLVHLRAISPSYRNFSIDLKWKSADWFPYENRLIFANKILPKLIREISRIFQVDIVSYLIVFFSNNSNNEIYWL